MRGTRRRPRSRRMSATRLMMRRVRSSSRCSTRDASSPWPRRRGSHRRCIGPGLRSCVVALELRLRPRRASRGAAGGSSAGRRDLHGFVVARDRLLELTHALAERAAHLGQALGPEHQQHDKADQEDLDPAQSRKARSETSTGGRPEGVSYDGQTEAKTAAPGDAVRDRTKWPLLELKDLTSRSRTEPRSSRASTSP